MHDIFANVILERLNWSTWRPWLASAGAAVKDGACLLRSEQKQYRVCYCNKGEPDSSGRTWITKWHTPPLKWGGEGGAIRPSLITFKNRTKRTGRENLTVETLTKNLKASSDEAKSWASPGPNTDPLIANQATTTNNLKPSTTEKKKGRNLNKNLQPKPNGEPKHHLIKKISERVESWAGRTVPEPGPENLAKIWSQPNSTGSHFYQGLYHLCKIFIKKKKKKGAPCR